MDARYWAAADADAIVLARGIALEDVTAQGDVDREACSSGQAIRDAAAFAVCQSERLDLAHCVEERERAELLDPGFADEFREVLAGIECPSGDDPLARVMERFAAMRRLLDDDDSMTVH